MPELDEDDFVAVGSLVIERGVNGWRWTREDMDNVAALGYVAAVYHQLVDDVKDATESVDDDESS